MGQTPEQGGKTYVDLGLYRIVHPKDDPETLFEFDPLSFVNVSGHLEIMATPYLVAQLRNGEVVHVNGRGRNGRADLFDLDGDEVASLVTLANGRKTGYVHLP